MPALSAIAIEGAKAVGKTATAARRAATVHALDRPGALELAAADPRRLLTGAQPVLIDEWQRFPPVWGGTHRPAPHASAHAHRAGRDRAGCQPRGPPGRSERAHRRQHSRLARRLRPRDLRLRVPLA